MTEMKNFNILGIIGIIGALLMIIGVFLSWVDFDLYIVSESASGWELFTDDDFDFVDYSYAPLVALVCGILSLVVTLVPTILGNLGRILGLVAFILAIVSVAVSLLFYTDFDAVLGFSVGIGMWVCIAGGIITIIGGILDMVSGKPA